MNTLPPQIEEKRKLKQMAANGSPNAAGLKRPRPDGLFALWEDWEGIMRAAPRRGGATSPCSLDDTSITSSGRRNCNYRRDTPHGAPRSKGRPQPLFGASASSGGFLRIDSQNQRAVATSFAAAVSPLPPRRKKHARKHKPVASRPLLGAPTENTSTMKMRLSFKRQPSSGGSPAPRSSLAGAITTGVSKTAKRMASLPSKLSSRKKRSTSEGKPDLGMAPPLCKYETMGTCKASSRSSSPLFDEEVKFAAHLEELQAARQNDPLHEGYHGEAEDGFSLSSPVCFSLDKVLSPSGSLSWNDEDSSFSPSFEEFRTILRQPDVRGSSLFVTCASLTPISPIDGDGGGAEGGPDNSIPSLRDELRISSDMIVEPEDRHGAPLAPLSPSKKPVHLWQKAGGKADEDLDTTQDMDDSMSQECQTAFTPYAFSVSSPRQSEGSTLEPAPETEVQEECGDANEGLRHSTSYHSIPSVISTEEGWPVDQSDILNETIVGAVADVDQSFVFGDAPPTHEASTKDAADSAMAWSALSMILGSPAPTSVTKKKRRRQPVNLWQEDGDFACDLEDLVLPLEDDNMPNLEIEEEAEDDCSIPSVSYDDAVHEETVIDNDVVPQLDCVVPDLDDAQDLPLFAPTASESSKKEVADSALAWTALAAILGSPAPSSVVKKSATKAKANLWEDGEAEDLLPEMQGQEEEDFDNEDESLCVPSIELDEPIDLEGLPESGNPGESTRQEENAKKEAAESVLAWSALGMLLGSPAPQVVSKKTRKSTGANLWGDGDAAGAEDLDDILLFDADAAEAADEKENEQDDASQDIPSLSGTYDEEDDDEHSIPSLFGISQGESNHSHSPMTVGVDLLSASPKLDSSSKKEAAESVLAWSALGMLLGSPAPKATLPRKKKREPQDLWGEEDALAEAFKSKCDVTEPPCIERSSSCLDPSNNIQSLIGVWEGRAMPVDEEEKKAEC